MINGPNLSSYWKKHICLKKLFYTSKPLFLALFLLIFLYFIFLSIWPTSNDPNEYIYINFTNDPDLTFSNFEEFYRPNFKYSHPFENSCRFPTLQPEDPTIYDFVDHSRQIQCPPAKFENLISQTRDGELLIGKSSAGLIEKWEMQCYYRVLSGSLYPKISEYEFEGSWKRLPINKRFKINKTQFVIKCWSNKTHNLIYHDAFINLPEKTDLPDVTDRYSIAILQIDSTSRNQFYRHMPQTLRFMRQNDFQILQGYTKVGDNSAINTMALLAGYSFESKYRGLADLLPRKRQLSVNQSHDDIFKHIKMVYDPMKKDGCAIMWNDDIGGVHGGLFHYQSFSGFRKPPTDYYFRPYYTYIYKNLDGAKICSNGKFLIPRWVDIWERFSTMYRQKCHFSFNHLSYFTHENGNNLELYDILVSDALGRMKSAGVFDNTILLIAGDHGQRLHSINNTYYGKIEERMPLASIYMPEKFRKSHPDLYRRLIENTNRFTSTFDVYETLRMLSELKYKKNIEILPRIPVGKTLFEEIPRDRSCRDAKVPINFCVCMEKLDFSGNITETIKRNSSLIINDYFHQKLSNSSCIFDWKIINKASLVVYAVTPMVRYGPRYLEEWENLITKHGKTPQIFHEIVEIEQSVTVRLNLAEQNKRQVIIRAVFRFQYQRRTVESLNLIIDPWISTSECQIYQIDKFCFSCNFNK